jgi:hypothetical protein
MPEPPPPDEDAMVRVAVADLEDQFDDVDTAPSRTPSANTWTSGSRRLE